MSTKLVYVLTCAPEATYIEQALISVWSARHWNPDAYIVLITDDKTDALLKGKRGEILKYISKKIVVPFDDDALSPMYRSRWIKTRVRQMIDGDFLFVDSDTICQRALDDIDAIDCEVGAVLESHLKVSDYCAGLYKNAKRVTEVIGVDLDDEQLYFSSGVLLVRDKIKAHTLYEKWHQYWMEGFSCGLKIDQPALAKANRETGHILQQIPDTYNCILFTRPPFVREAHILHIASYQNPSFLFKDKVMRFVRDNGIENHWLKQMILNPCATIMPFDYNLKHMSSKERRVWREELTAAWRGYGRYIDNTYVDFPIQSKLRNVVIFLLRAGFFRLGIMTCFAQRRIRLHQVEVPYNYCQK
jgi:hypothetical protein